MQDLTSWGINDHEEGILMPPAQRLDPFFGPCSCRQGGVGVWWQHWGRSLLLLLCSPPHVPSLLAEAGG
ncbi:hypothetical protein ATANTOWER_027559 [Ataeniobius toweri]|uniref:Uncharacterized protein n=1 Tax=Ataeniobius toweri TaxID=208326 RepID=A0ABU7BRS1_9TELE|nr:hypothetical protein [Ataeniobius toweri]